MLVYQNEKNQWESHLVCKCRKVSESAEKTLVYSLLHFEHHDGISEGER